jgi:membrane protease YdiL (CAAX protease family)
VIDKQKLGDLGFKKPSLWKRYAIIGFFFAAIYVLYWAESSIITLPTEPKPIFSRGVFSIPYSVLFALVVGFVEESSFRGYILRNFRDIYPDTKAVFYSALLFGIYHLSFVWILLGLTSPFETLVYWTFFVLFDVVVGLFLGYFYVISEQTLVGSITHHVSQLFLASFVPYSLATSNVIGLLLSTSAYIIILISLVLLKRRGWLSDSREA